MASKPSRDCPQCQQRCTLGALIPLEGGNKALAYLACANDACRCHVNEEWEFTYVVTNAVSRDKPLPPVPAIFRYRHANERAAILCCPCCGEPAAIEKSDKQSDSLIRRYAKCTASSCGVTFVFYCLLTAFVSSEEPSDDPLLSLITLMFNGEDKAALAALAKQEQTQRDRAQQQQADRQRREQEKAEEARRRARGQTSTLIVP